MRTRVALSGERKERAGDKVVIQALVISAWPVFNGVPFAYLEVHAAGSLLTSCPVSLRVFLLFVLTCALLMRVYDKIYEHFVQTRCSNKISDDEKRLEVY